MSGGALNYSYMRLRDTVDMILEETDNPLHLRFANHLLLCADALHDLEWMLSGDTGAGDEIPAIMKVVSEMDDYHD